jgi:hypothetical protein
MTNSRRIGALLAAGFPAVAAATDLSNNLSQATGGTESASVSRYLTASFRTDASTYTIGSVTLLLGNPAAGQATVAIYSSAGLEPASLVGTLNSPAAYSTTLAQTTFTSPGVSLAANSTYWVVLSPTSGSFDWAWAGDAGGSGVGFTHVWANSDDAGAFWWSIDSYPLQMSVSTAVACYANCDGSTMAPVLNANDFQCFLNSFAAATAYANCDGSTTAPVLNANDFQCFLNAFAAGCS